MKDINVLVFGGSGQLGKHLGLLDSKHHNIRIHTVDRVEGDVTRMIDVLSCFCNYKPTIVVNCAAYTDVNGCEVDKNHAFKVNIIGSGNVAAACKIANIPLIYISTDYVYSGNPRIRLPLTEQATVGPLNVYGWSKLSGEYISQLNNPNTYVFRTSWLYSEYTGNFIYKIVKRVVNNDDIAIVDNEIGIPTYCGDLAEAIIKACVSITKGKGPSTGVYHVCNSGAGVSRYEYGKEILHHLPYNTKIKKQTSSNMVQSVLRPEYTVLSSRKFTNSFGIQLPEWNSSIKYCTWECMNLVQREKESS